MFDKNWLTIVGTQKTWQKCVRLAWSLVMYAKWVRSSASWQAQWMLRISCSQIGSYRFAWFPMQMYVDTISISSIDVNPLHRLICMHRFDVLPENESNKNIPRWRFTALFKIIAEFHRWTTHTIFIYTRLEILQRTTYVKYWLIEHQYSYR